MAQIWMMEHGLLDEDEARRVLVIKQRRGSGRSAPAASPASARAATAVRASSAAASAAASRGSATALGSRSGSAAGGKSSGSAAKVEPSGGGRSVGPSSNGTARAGAKTPTSGGRKAAVKSYKDESKSSRLFTKLVTSKKRPLVKLRADSLPVLHTESHGGTADGYAFGSHDADDFYVTNHVTFLIHYNGWIDGAGEREVGSGIQLLAAALVTTLAAVHGLRDPASRVSMMQLSFYSFVGLGALNGYISTKIVSSFKSSNIMGSLLLSSLLPSTLVQGLLLLLNWTLHVGGYPHAIPLATSLSIYLWALSICSMTVYMGSLFGSFTSRTNTQPLFFSSGMHHERDSWELPKIGFRFGGGLLVSGAVGATLFYQSTRLPHQ
ncbi:unnamed protein product [Closterium sp. NIES-54]